MEKVMLSEENSRQKVPDETSIKSGVEATLKEFQETIIKAADCFAGYPDNLTYDYTALLPFLQYSLINAGDPFVETDWSLHSKQFERECISWFAQLYELSDYWGYVTSGGTEGNFYGIFLGRELCPDGVLYFSQDSHYSVAKAAYLMKIPHVIINSLSNGEIDCDHLEYELIKRKHKSAIVNLNVGTTMKGAVDDLVRITDILVKAKTQFHLHCDAALGGMLLPFIKEAPKISFQDYPIGSLAVSGNKFIGAPIPHGIILSRPELVTKMGMQVDYIGCTDTTILGVRSGLASLFLWYAIQTRGENFVKEVSSCLENAQYLRDRLISLGYNPLLNDFSNIVVFEKPSREICQQWQLATKDNLAHIVVMQHLSIDKIDRFIQDLIQSEVNR